MIKSSLKISFISQFPASDVELFLLYLTVRTLLFGLRYLCKFIEHVMVQVCSTQFRFVFSKYIVYSSVALTVIH